MWQQLQALLSHPDPVLYAIPVFIVTMLVEALISRHERDGNYESRDSWASIGMGLGSVVVNLVAKSIAFLWLSWLYEYRVFDLSLTWWVVVLLVLGDDFSFYWAHRIGHEVRLFWAAHVNHHSSQHFNLSTALRQSWTEVLYKYYLWSWMPLLGFHPLWIFVAISCNLIYQYWVHTIYIRRMPAWFEWLFNTPSHHRVHHASNARYLDKNYAGILIIWDRLLGTFEAERDDEPVVFGLTSNISSHHLLHIAGHEFRALWRDLRHAPNWRARLKYLFGAPGWRHDGVGTTAAELRSRTVGPYSNDDPRPQS